MGHSVTYQCTDDTQSRIDKDKAISIPHNIFTKV